MPIIARKSKQLKGTKHGQRKSLKPDILRFKIVVVGDSSVGKSCLLVRYADQLFNRNYIATIGVDFRDKSFVVDGKKVRLQIWDTAGHERFRSINSSYFRGCDGALICYDVCDRESFRNVTYHLAQVQENGGRYVSLILVGNKADSLAAHREVSYEEAKALAEELEIPLFEVSAKADQDVTLPFESIARQCIAQKNLERHLKRKQQKELKRLTAENKEKSTKIKFKDMKQAVRQNRQSKKCGC